MDFCIHFFQSIARLKVFIDAGCCDIKSLIVIFLHNRRMLMKMNDFLCSYKMKQFSKREEVIVILDLAICGIWHLDT